MAGVQPSAIVNGQSVAPIYSPAWYQAQQQDAIRRAGIGGTAAGTGEANYLSALSPSLQGLYAATGLTGGTSGGGSTIGGEPVSSGGVTAGSGTPTPVTATIAPLDFSAANTAAFATAKDQAAQTAQASLQGLNQALGARGLTGGGYEAGQIGQTLASEANTIGAAGRAEAQSEAQLQAQAAGENYQGAVTQRGQDIGSQTAAAQRAAAGQATAYQGQIAQRQQDIQAQEAAAALAQQQAQLKSTQTLNILRTVLGGGPQGATPYVY